MWVTSGLDPQSQNFTKDGEMLLLTFRLNAPGHRQLFGVMFG